VEWWRSVVKGEPEINSRKVEPEKSRLDELDSETRQTAEKMMVRIKNISIFRIKSSKCGLFPFCPQMKKSDAEVEMAI